MATRSKLKNQMPAKRGDSPKSPLQNISSNVKLTNRMAANSEPKKKIPSKQGDIAKSKIFSNSADDADTENIDLINSEIHNVELDEAKSSKATTSILKKKKLVVSLVRIRRMAILEESEHKTTLELPKATKSSQTQSKQKPVISSQKRESKSVDHDVDSKLKTVDPNRREVAQILSLTINRKKPDPDFQLNGKTASKIQEAAANHSTQPMYKRKLGDNKIATTSVFDSTTNSQNFSTDSDEPLKDVIQKMVCENKAIVKHKEKKGVTKAKDRVTQTKSKLQNPLSRLIEVKHFGTKFGPKATITLSRNIKQPAEPPKRFPISTTMISETNPNEPVYPFNEMTVGVKNSSKDNQNEKIAVLDSFDCEKQVSKPSKMVSDSTKVLFGTTPNDSINESEGMESLSKYNEIGEIGELSHIWYNPSTPSRVLPITYRANKKALPKSTQQPSHQSTPVRQIRTASPWRVPDSSSSIDFDFSKINNHDEGKDDIKENEGNSTSSDRTNKKNQRQPLNTKQTSDDLKKTEKIFSNDIKNYFGSTDDESDNDGNITETTPIRKRLPPTRESLPHINTFIISTKSTLKDQRLRKINNQAKSNEQVIPPINTTPGGKKQVGNNSPIRKRLQPTREGLPHIINTSTKLTLKDQPLRNINNKAKSNIKLIQQTITSFQKPEGVTDKQVGNIHGAVNELAAQPIISNDQENPINNNTDSSNQRFKRLTALHNFFTSNKYQKPCSSTDPIPDDENDGLALFDTNWLQQENKKNRSCTRVPKRTYDDENILTDDECGDMPTQRRTKKTKMKVDNGFEEQNPPIDVIQLSERLDIIEKNFEVVNTEISGLRKELQEMKLENSEFKKKLETLNDPAATETVIIPSDGRGIYQQLPLNSIDELETFKENLKVREKFIHLENRLGAIGGTDVKACLTRIFNKILTKDLQQQISLTGKQTEKGSLLKYTTIMDLIHGAVRLNYNDYKDITGEKIIGVLLRNR